MPGKQYLVNTFLWGFILWFIGYLAGIVLFFIVPKDLIGWIITPLATILTVWVLLRKVRRPSLASYISLGIIWTIMAIALDYLFLVTFFKTGSAYYKPDVILYYFFTLILPVVIGFRKAGHKQAGAELF